MYQISLGSRAGVLNRAFTIAMLLLIVVQVWRLFHFHFRLVRWRYRLHLLEQEAREEGVVTVTDPEALPPVNPYARFWEMVPSMAIMFGLLGTFIGLTLSLSEIPVTGDVEAIQKGLSRSIPSMGTAFWTSLSGLVVAISVRITNSFMASEFRARVIQQLLSSEPEVIEALESAAFQQGRDGALLRPHGIRELLWHQNRLLNNTVARVAPQISDGIARGLGQLNHLPGGGGSDQAVFSQLEQVTRELKQWQEEQRAAAQEENQHLRELVEQQRQLTQSMTREMAGFQTQIARLTSTLTSSGQPAVSPEQAENATVAEVPAAKTSDWPHHK
tara:strand:- start:4846 stop:5835 length:990 start_codon:yes stop_codon:yes gene_type:complete